MTNRIPGYSYQLPLEEVAQQDPAVPRVVVDICKLLLVATAGRVNHGDDLPDRITFHRPTYLIEKEIPFARHGCTSRASAAEMPDPKCSITVASRCSWVAMLLSSSLLMAHNGSLKQFEANTGY